MFLSSIHSLMLTLKRTILVLSCLTFPSKLQLKWALCIITNELKAHKTTSSDTHSALTQKTKSIICYSVSHGNPDCCQQTGGRGLGVAVETIRALGKAGQKVKKPPSSLVTHTYTYTHTHSLTHKMKRPHSQRSYFSSLLN